MGLEAYINLEVRESDRWQFVASALLRPRSPEMFEKLGLQDNTGSVIPLLEAVPDASIGAQVRFNVDYGYSINVYDITEFREFIHWHWSLQDNQLDTRPSFSPVTRDWCKQCLDSEEDGHLIIEPFMTDWPEKDCSYGDAVRVICWFT